MQGHGVGLGSLGLRALATAAALAASAVGCVSSEPRVDPPPPVAATPPRVDVGAELASGRAALAAGRADEARGHFERAIGANPRAVEPRLDLAELLVSHGEDLGRAGALLDEAAAVRPEDARLERLRGALRELDEDEEGAAAAYGRSLALEPDAELRLRRGMLLLQSGETEDAVVELERVRAERPGDRAARGSLADGYEALGRLPQAQAELEELVRLDPSSGAPLRRLAAFLRYHGGAGQAARAEARARGLEAPARALRPLLRSKR